MAATVWSDVKVELQSALATAVVINGITQASPAVISYTDAGASDPTDGDYVVFPDLSGMFQMNDRVVRVINTDTVNDTFEAEDVNSTNYGTFATGNFQIITFGTTLSGVTDVTASGGTPRFADATTIHDQQVKEIPTVVDPFELGFEHLFDAGDTALQAMIVASENREKRAMRITFNNNNIVVFYGYITATGIPTGSALEVVKTTVNMKSSGIVKAYAA